MIKIDLSPNALAERKLTSSLLEINSTTQKYGLFLTEAIAREIAAARGKSLSDNGRIDFSPDPIVRLIKAFSESRYITQEDFSWVISEVIELFYFLRNEVEDVLSDDDMISEMLVVFTETCAGSIEIMQSKGVEKIVRKYRFGDTQIWSDYENCGRIDYVDPENKRLEDWWEHGETWRE